MKKPKKKFIPLLFIIISTFNLFGIFLWATHHEEWLIRLNNDLTISKNDFELEYMSYLEYEKLKSLFLSKKDIEKLKQDSHQKKLFLYNYISEILVYNKAKALKLFDEKQLIQKVENLKNNLKRQIVKQIYINQAIKKEIKTLDPNIIQKYYEEIIRDPKNKHLDIKAKKEMSEKKALLKAIELKYLESINDLKNQNQIKINDSFF